MDFLDANNLALVVGGVAVGAAAMTLLGGSAGAAKKKTGGRAKVRPLPPALPPPSPSTRAQGTPRQAGFRA